MSEQQGQSGGSLHERLRQEARELADDSGVPFERVYDCEMAMFTYHCATGDDLDCVCGAHGLPPQPAVEYRPEDFA